MEARRTLVAKSQGSGQKGNNQTGIAEKQKLGQWITKGWKNREADKLRLSYLLYDKGRHSFIIYTLAFALLGKEGTMEKAESTLDRVLSNGNGHGDWRQILGKALGVEPELIRNIERLEGPANRKRPCEIAELLSEGKV